MLEHRHLKANKALWLWLQKEEMIKQGSLTWADVKRQQQQNYRLYSYKSPKSGTDRVYELTHKISVVWDNNPFGLTVNQTLVIMTMTFKTALKT